MSFRRSSNDVEAWLAFCRERKEPVCRLRGLESAFASADRFDEYLRIGEAGNAPAMSSLDGERWRALASFVQDYERDWQSWFARSLYVAYFAESDRRAALSR